MRVIQSKGQLHQRMVTIVMNGLPRAGKTTTKQRLLGHILQLLEVSPSTGVVEPSLKITITELLKSSAIVSGSQWSLLSRDNESLHLVNAILLAAENLKSKSRIASALSDITQTFRPGIPTDPTPLPSSSRASKQPKPSQSANLQQVAPSATVANASEFCVAPPDQLFVEVLTEH